MDKDRNINLLEDENIFFEDINEYDKYVDYQDSLKEDIKE